MLLTLTALAVTLASPASVLLGPGGVVRPGLAMRLSPATSTASVHAANDFPAPVVLLEPRGGKNSELAPLFESGPVVTGLAISEYRVVISTLGLAAALPAEPGDAAAPDRLAKKVLKAVRQQYWSVKGWDGKIREGQLVLVAGGGQIGIIQLDEPLPKPPTTTAKLSRSVARVVGVDASGDALRVLEFDAELVPVSEGRAYVRGQLPATFEGAVVFDRNGAWIGSLNGTSTPGAPVVFTRDAIETMVMEARKERHREIEWSIGAWLGTSFVQRRNLSGRTALGVRADLWIDRRWTFALETGWTTDLSEQISTDPTYTTNRRRRDHFPAVVVMQYMAGPKASRFRVAPALGVGALAVLERNNAVAIDVASGCVSEPCPIHAESVSEFSTFGRFLVVGGLDLVNFASGPWRSITGVRAGYRMQVSLPDITQSMHLITVVLHI